MSGKNQKRTFLHRWRGFRDARKQEKYDWTYVHSKEKELAGKIRLGATIERYLKDGDICIFNRQPTLSKNSMMAHRAKIVPGLTFQLPVPNCTPYNAVLMAMRWIYTYVNQYQRVEMNEIMRVDKLLLGGQQSRPIIGCVQDSVTGLFLMTSKNTILTGINSLAFPAIYTMPSSIRVKFALR